MLSLLPWLFSTFLLSGAQCQGVGSPGLAQSNQACEPTKSCSKPLSKPGKGTDFRPSGMNQLHQEARGGSWGTHQSSQTLSLAWPAMGGPCRLAGLAQEEAG